MRNTFFALATTIMASALVLLSVAPASADNVSFNYQGRVKAHGQPVNGVGLFKFAILNTPGSAVLWSNDGTVGTGTGPEDIPEPSSAVALPVSDGIFSILVGDENIPGMAPLDSAVMVSNTPLRLRVWFSNGEDGFQRLNPDHKLMDLTLTKIQTGTENFTIYVNGENGNDANNGLSPETAKKTITGAVNILPDKIRCNITVSIAPGIYREVVTPHGLSVAYGNTLKFIGDAEWTPADGGAPDVIIDAADSGEEPAREYCFYARQCTGIIIEGITFQHSKVSGLKMENGTYTVNRCLARRNATNGIATGIGFQAGPQCYAHFNECTGTDNAFIGFVIDSSSRAYLTTCTATLNNIGVFATSNSVAQFFGYNYFANNEIGVQANGMADVSVWPSQSNDTRTHIQNNSKHAGVVNWNGQFTPADAIMSGNGNSSADRYLRYYGTIIGVDPQ